MRRLRVLLLFNARLAPPGKRSELDRRPADVRASFELVAALRKLGHELRVLGVHDDLAPVRAAIEEWRPHVVFNQLLDFHGTALYDAHVVGYLELLKAPYTGCNPRGILLASDKALSKRLLAHHGIRVPRFALVPRGRRAAPPPGTAFPLFVKSAVDHGSVGIAQASIVRDARALRRRVEFVHANLGADALVEEYVEGRELTVSLLGNTRVTALPVWELSFGTLPAGTAPIATARVKWSKAYQRKLGIVSGRARLPAAKQREIVRTAKRVFRALGLSGYARVDLRLDAAGRVYVLEANPNPDLSRSEDFEESAAAAGLAYPELLQRIIDLGRAYRPGWMRAD